MKYDKKNILTSLFFYKWKIIIVVHIPSELMVATI